MKLKLKEWIDKVSLALNRDLYHIESVSSTGLSGSTYYASYNITIPTVSGYTPVALKRLSFNQANIFAFSQSVSGTTLGLGVTKNTPSGTISGLIITADVLYIRDTVGGVLLSSIFKAFSDFTSHLLGVM